MSKPNMKKEDESSVVDSISIRIKEEEAKREKKRKRIEAWKQYAATKPETQLKVEAPMVLIQENGEIDTLDAFMQEVGQQISKEQVETTSSSSNQSHSKLGERLTDVNEGAPSDEEEEEEDEEFMLPKKLRKKVVPIGESVEYHSFKKDLYTEVPEITSMTDKEVLQVRKELEVRVRGKNCPKPIKRFTQCGLGSKVLEVMLKNKYEIPTPIQAQAIPAAMSGRDVIGIARTGSGKTLAYLLPMLRQIENQYPYPIGNGPIGLILAPTRELAIQIDGEVKKFCKAYSVHSVCCYGGTNISDQIAQLKRGCELIVATPGRMIDLLCANKGKLVDLHRCTIVVLDEADRMFDMGFEPQITAIVNAIRKDRQTLLFSATFPLKVEALAKQILNSPIEITVGQRTVVCEDIEQHIEILTESQKWNRLLELISEYTEKGQILIFVDRQSSADYLFTKLCKAGFPVASLHGGLDQSDRDTAIQDFKKKVKKIMVATSVAARGLDVEDLNLVINYDVPNHLEDYVHRVGRTGRAGKKGTAYTFIQQDEEQFAPDLIKALEQSGQTVPEPLKAIAEEYKKKKSEGKLVEIHSSGFVGRGYKFDEAEAEKPQEMRKLLALEYGESELEEDEIEKTKEKLGLIKKEDLTAVSPSLSVSSTPSLVQKPGNAPETPELMRALEIANKLVSSRNAPSPTSKMEQPAPEGAKFEEIEINEYPQDARWKVINGDFIKQVYELSGVTILVKGVFVGPGKKLQPGERKLYLQLQGTDPGAVMSIKYDILKTLKEATLNSKVMQHGGIV